MLHLFHRHKRSLFPAVLGALTLLLLGFMLYSFSEQAPQEDQGTISPISQDTSLTEQEEPQITPEEYEQAMREVMYPFYETFAHRDPLQQLVLAEDTLSAVLALHVPADYREVHVEAASALHALREALRSENAEEEEVAITRLNRVLAENLWLNE